MYDALIIGSGFGGAMTAHRLVRAGWRVLMIERGDWVCRDPSRRDPSASFELTPYYSKESAYHCLSGGEDAEVGALFCVGGPSVFYGGASFRLREEDFTPGPGDRQRVEGRVAVRLRRARTLLRRGRVRSRGRR